MVYSTGTATLRRNTAKVFGTGTLWARNVFAGQFIQLGSVWYLVVAVQSDTVLLIAQTYLGPDLVGVAYVAAVSDPSQPAVSVTQYSGVTVGGAYLQWNRNNSGATYLINQCGTGQGGILLGESDQSNGFTMSATITASLATFSGAITTKAHTVADLPLPSAELRGARLHVIDADGPSFMSQVVGGGTQACPVFCDGSIWVAG